MTSVLISLLLTLRGLVSSRIALHLEVLALRHQLQVLQRSRPRRLRLMKADRWLWAWLSTSWPAWRMFLTNHLHQIAAADFFVVPTATCRLLFVLVILAHERRRIVHVAVTDHTSPPGRPNSSVKRSRWMRRRDIWSTIETVAFVKFGRKIADFVMRETHELWAHSRRDIEKTEVC
jgi:hypothetical protein